MTRKLSLLLILLLPVVLVACGGNTPPEPEDVEVESALDVTLPESDADVVLAVRGETTINAERDAAVFCREPNGTRIIRLTVVGGGDQVYLTVPASTTGTVPVTGTPDIDTAATDGVYITYRNNVTNYGTGTGEMTVTSIPTADGEVFSADLTAELNSDNDTTITIQARFNADAAEGAFEDCTA